MIINSDGTALGSAAGSDKQREHERQSELGAVSAVPTDDLPPYSPATASPSSATDTAPTSTHPQSAMPSLKPVNFLSLSRAFSPVKGQFLLDPTLSIPPSVLPPLAEGQTELDRKNLSLTSRGKDVKCEVWIVSGDQRGIVGVTGRRRASIQALSEFSSVTVKIHQADTPFILVAKSVAKPVSVYIPRSFRGPVHASTDFGSPKFSSALISNVTLFSDVGNKRHGFIGDIAGSGWGESDGDEWDGDELVIKSAWGSVSVSYVDEPPKTGFVAWLQNALS